MNMTIRMAKAMRHNGWYKWLPQKTYSPYDIGGLDIMTAVPNLHNSHWHEMAFINRRLPSQDDLIPITFQTFPAFIATREEVEGYIDERYGTKWRSEITSASPYIDIIEV